MVILCSFILINSPSFTEVALIKKKKNVAGQCSLTHKKDSGLKNPFNSTKTQTNFFFH